METFVYVMFSEGHDRFYVGLSADPMKRLEEHNRGFSKSTRPYPPWRMVHIEAYPTREAAREREKYLKSAAGRRWRQKNIDLGD